MNLQNKRPDDFILAFEAFSQDPVRPLIWLVVFLLLTHFVIVKGVKDGIEKSSKILMPVLFILIILLAVCSLSLPNAEKGLEFLLKPDFSKVTGDVFLGAMGSSLFLLMLGDGMSLHLCLLFWKRDKVGEYGVECRSHRHICCSIGRCHYFPCWHFRLAFSPMPVLL